MQRSRLHHAVGLLQRDNQHLRRAALWETAVRLRSASGLLTHPGTYRRRFNMRLAEWALRHQRTLGQATWFGVPALKNPMDAWIYQEIIHEVRPETIIEIGGLMGGGTLYLAHLLELIGGTGRVISVEIDRSNWRAPDHPRILKIDGDSGDRQLVESVRELATGTTMVIHDGDHRRDGVARDLELWAPLVTAGSYLIVEDGIIDLFRAGDGIGSDEDGPLPAIAAFLAAHPEFEPDQERERYVMTYNPRGFLRRKPVLGDTTA